MFNSTEEKIREVEKKIMMMGIYDTPGMLMIGLWAYARFASDGEPFHPALSSDLVQNGLLFGGIAIVAVCGIQVVKLSLRKAELTRELDSQQGNS